MLLFTKAINTISRCTMMYRSDHLQASGLSGYQVTYLLAICRFPGISQEDIAKTIYVNKSNVTRQLVNLEESGWIIRKTNEEDQRQIKVYPAEKALAILPKIRQIFGDWNEFITQDFTKEEKEQFANLLEKMSKKAQSYIDQRNEGSL